MRVDMKTNNTQFGSSYKTKILMTKCIGTAATIAATAAVTTCTYKGLKNGNNTDTNTTQYNTMISDLNLEKKQYVESLNNEKDILIKKNMSADEFMTRLREVEKNKALYKLAFYTSNDSKEQTPIVIQELRKKQQKIYANLSPEEKQKLVDIVRNIMYNISLTQERELKPDIDVQEKTLAVLELLHKTVPSTTTIQTGGNSEKEYARALGEAINNYFTLSDIPYATDLIGNTLKSARDSIAANMTQEELIEYNSKYEKVINNIETAVNSKISEIEAQTDRPLSGDDYAVLIIIALVIIAVGGGTTAYRVKDLCDEQDYEEYWNSSNRWRNRNY